MKVREGKQILEIIKMDAEKRWTQLLHLYREFTSRVLHVILASLSQNDKTNLKKCRKMGRTNAHQVWNTFYMKKGYIKLFILDEEKLV